MLEKKLKFKVKRREKRATIEKRANEMKKINDNFAFLLIRILSIVLFSYQINEYAYKCIVT